MPVIEMYVTAGVLDDEAKRAVHERVSRRVLEAEGGSYESDMARAITWVLIHEMPEGTWSVGSEVLAPPDEHRILTRVTVPHGAAKDGQRERIAAGVNEEIVVALGDDFVDPLKSFCIIQEGDFAGGSTLVDYAQLVQMLEGEDGDGARPDRSDDAVHA